MNILQEADKLTSIDRNGSYGPPKQDFERTAKMWSAILNTEVSARQIALCMIALKLSRLAYRMKRDSIVDVAGYARTLEMIDESENQKRNENPVHSRQSARKR
jgi:hypothetical protein